MGDAAPGDIGGRLPEQALTIELDAPASVDHAREGAQDRRLPGAVRSEHRSLLALVHREVDPL
jgi:hypothetical protein